MVGVLGTVVMGQTDDFNCPDLHIGFYPHLYRWDYLISGQDTYSICFLTMSLTLILIFCYVQLWQVLVLSGGQIRAQDLWKWTGLHWHWPHLHPWTMQWASSCRMWRQNWTWTSNIHSTLSTSMGNIWRWGQFTSWNCYIKILLASSDLSMKYSELLQWLISIIWWWMMLPANYNPLTTWILDISFIIHILSRSFFQQDCGVFWVCMDGKANRYQCPPGLAYDKESRGCRWADQVPECSNVVVIDEDGGEFQCPRESTPGIFTKHAHPADCR